MKSTMQLKVEKAVDDLDELMGNPFATNNRNLLEKIQLIEDRDDYAGQYTKEIGTMLFNEKPKIGIQFCIEHKIIKKATPPLVAKFLHQTPGLSKFAIGQFLGSQHTEKEIIQAYIDQFPFKGEAIDIDIREFMSKFRMPSESQ